MPIGLLTPSYFIGCVSGCLPCLAGFALIGRDYCPRVSLVPASDYFHCPILIELTSNGDHFHCRSVFSGTTILYPIPITVLM